MSAHQSEFTGERVVPGVTPARIYADHAARYSFAAKHDRGRAGLDVACGTGYGSQILSDGGADSVVGADISEDAISYAIDSYSSPTVQFEIGDALEVPGSYWR